MQRNHFGGDSRRAPRPCQGRGWGLAVLSWAVALSAPAATLAAPTVAPPPGATAPAGAAPSSVARPAVAARRFALSIGHGSGGGEYPPNTLVHIWADPAPAGSVFDRWTGGLEPLIDRYAAHTTLVMPASRLAVGAVFKRAPGCAPTTEPIQRVEVTWCLPEKHAGIIVVFHGHEGSGATFFRGTEARLFVEDAAAAGFGLIALDSADREHKSWQLKAAGMNPDVQNVRAVLDELRRRRLVAPDEPTYGLGVGPGGNFAAHVAQRLRFKAVAIFVAPGAPPPDYEVPTIWLMAQNAVNPEPRALAEFTRLAQRQVAAKLNINEPSPVYPLRFWRIPGVQPDDSRAIYRLLKDKGYLDAGDMLKQDPESSGWETTLPERFAKLRGALREQLDVCFALPRFYSDFDNRILDFFNEHR